MAVNGTISDLRLLPDQQHLLVSTHEGDLFLLDLRSGQTVQELRGVHQRKYEEGALCIAVHPRMPFFATGGADQVIKFFELQA